MRIVFMGTPDFAVPCLQALLQQAYDVVGVFTQPDKPKGRGYKMVPPPVKAAAVEAGLSVYQPLSLRKGEEAEQAMQTLQELNPDVIVVVAYGQILPKAVSGFAKVRLYQYSRFAAASLSRSSTDADVSIEWGNRNRSHLHADGRGLGYRRYAGKGSIADWSR